jgi:heme oxygenase
MARLRDETRSTHERVEALPFFARLQAGDLPLPHYVEFLTGLEIIHDDLEDALGTSQDPRVVAVWDDSLRRLPALRRDVAFFASARPTRVTRPMLHAIMVGEEIRLRQQRAPVWLLGALYVLQGSALGGLLLRSAVRQAFGLSDNRGLAYLAGNQSATRAVWTAFGARMEQAVTREHDQDLVVEAAQETFEGIERVVSALETDEPEQRHTLVTSLNPQAGSHAIADDPAEIRAALRAGVLSWERFPYYEWRYGRRGRRFTRSDSAWIVTLAAEQQTVIDHHLDWLGQVLAARGMPRWLLESHLEILSGELARARPERQPDYQKLLNGALRLRQARENIFRPDQWHALVAAFEAAVGVEWNARLPHIGELLVAAIADEQNGVKNVVQSLAGWLTDPARFPDHWIEAVHRSLALARAAASRNASTAAAGP